MKREFYGNTILVVRFNTSWINMEIEYFCPIWIIPTKNINFEGDLLIAGKIFRKYDNMNTI